MSTEERLHPSHSEYLTVAVFVEVTRGYYGHGQGRGHCMKATPATRPHRRFCGENIRTVNGTPANLIMLIKLRVFLLIETAVTLIYQDTIQNW